MMRGEGNKGCLKGGESVWEYKCRRVRGLVDGGVEGLTNSGGGVNINTP